MDSRFNIPAPAMVKLQSDVLAERSCRLKVAVAQADAETSVEVDFLKQVPRKASREVERARTKTDTGGQVENTKAIGRTLEKELGKMAP